LLLKLTLGPKAGHRWTHIQHPFPYFKQLPIGPEEPVVSINTSPSIFVSSANIISSIASPFLLISTTLLIKYGNGCCMCVQRCPAFGPRVSLSNKAGAKDLIGKRTKEIYGAMSGSCKLNKDTLGPAIREELDEKGVVVVSIPEKLIKKEKLSMKVCQQYALDDYAQNIVLLDTGYAKLMTPFFSLADIRTIEGFENVRFEDPYAGGKGNSIRYMSMAPRNNYMQVIGVENLFCAGEKSGPFVGHTEAICTGILAGHNSVRKALGIKLLSLPSDLVIGDIISFVNDQLKTDEGLHKRFTFAGSTYFGRMKQLGFYETSPDTIKMKVERLGLSGVFNQNLVNS
jgi:hypothetical protein